jgi:predicted enzyme related to lactoylglutathione lyase
MKYLWQAKSKHPGDGARRRERCIPRSAAILYKSRVGTGGFSDSSEEPVREARSMGSPIVHFELIGKDAAQLKEFYTQLFDWQIGDLLPDTGNYGLIDGASSGLAGGVGQSDDGKPRTSVYAQVPDPQATLDKAVALGASVLMPPTEVVPGTTIAMFPDPAGNIFGLTKG